MGGRPRVGARGLHVAGWDGGGPAWDDGEGLDLTSWLECTFYRTGDWPGNASWSLPADVPESQLLKWTRDTLRGRHDLEGPRLWFERRAVVEAVGAGAFKRRAVLLARGDA